MWKLLALATLVPVAGCQVGSSGALPDASEPTGGDGGSGSGSSSGNVINISGTITSSTTWSGTVNVLDSITVPTGVTVTVEPGTTIQSGTGDQEIITLMGGELDENGAKGNVVTVDNIAYRVGDAGTLNVTYGAHTATSIDTGQNATVTITDTYMARTIGDLLVMSGGNVSMQYSQIGIGDPMETTRGSDSTHCDMHFNAVPNSVMKINFSNITSSAYGIMLYANDADLTNNNWWDNTVDFEPGQTSVTGGSADGGWFKSGAPSGVPGVTFNNLATSPLTAGPR